MKNINKYKNEIFLIITTLLFITITYITLTNKITYLDSLIHSYILTIRNDNLTNILLVITNSSSAQALIILSIILLIIIKNKKIPLYIILNLISAFTLNQITKLIFSRPRPIGINLIEETGFSYPSGHAMVSMAYFGFIIYLIYKNVKHKKIKQILITTLSIIILLVGFSRIYLGVHYLSDIFGGFLLSIIHLQIFIKVINFKKAGTI